MNNSLPTIFVSHGAPTLILEDIPARDFIAGLGSVFNGVKAILCVSAHWETSSPSVTGGVHLQTIHDFYGFPDELYDIKYPANGDPALAGRIAGLIRDAGLECDEDIERGLDHGAWIPLKLMFPEANIPVLQLSIQHHLDPDKHIELGKAISGLRHEGVLVIGSGGAVHPLGYDITPRETPHDWAIKFDDWLTKAVTTGDVDSLIRFRELAPYPERAQPRPDHYMPLMTVIGAAYPDTKGNVIHKSWQWGILGMGAFSFGD